MVQIIGSIQNICMISNEMLSKKMYQLPTIFENSNFNNSQIEFDFASVWVSIFLFESAAREMTTVSAYFIKLTGD